MTMSLSAAAVLYSSGSVISARADLVTRGLDEREDLRPDADKAVAREREMAGDRPSDTPEEARRAEPRDALPPAGGREDYASRAEMSSGRARSAIEALQHRIEAMVAALERLKGAGEYGTDRILYIATGAGDDVLSINDSHVGAIATGAGNDAVAVAADAVDSIQTGDGNDAVAVMAEEVGRIAGGKGNDAIAVDAGIIGVIRGGEGNDAIAAAASVIGGVGGGKGNDSIAVLAHRVGEVRGGAGNDTIDITALEAGFSGEGIRGGRGDDQIRIQAEEARMGFAMGDGHDKVVIGAGTDLLIDLGADLAAGPGDVSIEMGSDGSVMLKFASGDSIHLQNPADAASITLNFGEAGTFSLEDVIAIASGGGSGSSGSGSADRTPDATLAGSAAASVSSGPTAVIHPVDPEAELPDNAEAEVPVIPGLEEEAERESAPSKRPDEPGIAVDTGPDSVARGEELSEPLDLRI
ncbi:MAG: calcium-binding protein [Alphaproteobacteria bacterium]|nr:MAG: calcium-binding protein [Alphaproteobacteria bacterium]